MCWFWNYPLLFLPLLLTSLVRSLLLQPCLRLLAGLVHLLPKLAKRLVGKSQLQLLQLLLRISEHEQILEFHRAELMQLVLYIEQQALREPKDFPDLF